jgi:Putative peptidoglycan binding domain
MTAAEVLTSNGIQRAAEVVELAAVPGLELAAAATLLEKESFGGQNIFGHDDVDTGGFYVKGAEVTEDAYLRYKAHRAQFGAQGVGPTQLTLPAFQDRADARGGCFNWRVNIAVGFDILAGYIKAQGVHNGFLAYNGTEDYAIDAVEKLAVWRSRLGGTPSGTPYVVHEPLREGDTGPAVAALQKWLNATFPAYSHIDLGPQRYGPQTVAVIAEFQRRAGVTGPDADGRTVGPRTWAALEHYGYH